MRQTIRAGFVSLAAVLLVSANASAQYKQYPVSDPATGEKYVVEGAFGFWNPDPTLVISSEGLGILGSEIDAIADLGMTQTTFKEFRFVLRPAKKHKFRFDYVPIVYEAEVILQKEIIFNGIRYEVGLPVNSKLDWRAIRLGYEWDFLYRDRWFVGLLLEAKYTDVRVDLATPLREADFAEARAPIPAIGGIGRFYPVSNISVTADFSLFKLPSSVDRERRYEGDILDWDIYGTVNFTNNIGAQVGYRSMNVYYKVKNDSGDMKLRGLYFMGVARF